MDSLECVRPRNSFAFVCVCVRVREEREFIESVYVRGRMKEKESKS
jgi:hypothetical protein